MQWLTDCTSNESTTVVSVDDGLACRSRPRVGVCGGVERQAIKAWPRALFDEDGMTFNKVTFMLVRLASLPFGLHSYITHAV